MSTVVCKTILWYLSSSIAHLPWTRHVSQRSIMLLDAQDFCDLHLACAGGLHVVLDQRHVNVVKHLNRCQIEQPSCNVQRGRHEHVPAGDKYAHAGVLNV